MFYQNKNTFWVMFLSAALLFASISCDSILPDEFDEDKSYSLPEIDGRACNILSKEITDSTGAFIPFSAQLINTKTIASLVDSATSADLTENQIIVSRFNELAGNLESLIRDSLLAISYPVNQTTSYVILTVSPGEAKDIYLYTSFVFTQSNINESVDIQFIKNDSSLVSFNDDMPTEVVSECSQVVSTKTVPTIKTRKKIHLEEGIYFVRFNVSSPALVGFLKLVIFSI